MRIHAQLIQRSINISPQAVRGMKSELTDFTEVHWLKSSEVDLIPLSGKK